jgi:hypothetical protein
MSKPRWSRKLLEAKKIDWRYGAGGDNGRDHDVTAARESQTESCSLKGTGEMLY